MRRSITDCRIRRALQILIEGRATHQAWLGMPTKTMRSRGKTRAQVGGDKAHHRKCIREYDYVIGLIKDLTQELEITE